MNEYRVATLDVDGFAREFLFVGGPIDEPSGADELFAAIGNAAASWARLEQHLDAVLMHVNNPQHSSQLYNPDHPRSFQSKIKLLKTWFNQHPALGNLAGDFRRLNPHLKEMADHRNILLHGNLEKWDADRQTACFWTLRYTGEDEFQLVPHEYTIEAIKTVTVKIRSANHYLEAISRSLFSCDTHLRER